MDPRPPIRTYEEWVEETSTAMGIADSPRATSPLIQPPVRLPNGEYNLEIKEAQAADRNFHASIGLQFGAAIARVHAQDRRSHARNETIGQAASASALLNSSPAFFRAARERNNVPNEELVYHPISETFVPIKSSISEPLPARRLSQSDQDALRILEGIARVKAQEEELARKYGGAP
jgi:hypothetical protein